jgi:hypothetical protein
MVARRVIGQRTREHIFDCPSVFLDIFLFRLGPVVVDVRRRWVKFHLAGKIHVVGLSPVFVAKVLRWNVGDDVATLHVSGFETASGLPR